MALVVILAAFGIMPITVGAVAGVLVMMLTRCLNWQDALQALSVQVVMIIVASLALGVALMRTGGAEWLAQVFLALSFGIPSWAIFGFLMLVFDMLSHAVSNDAGSVIGTPIAFSLAPQPMRP